MGTIDRGQRQSSLGRMGKCLVIGVTSIVVYSPTAMAESTGLPECGAHVTFGAWRSSLGIEERPWSWNYYNCSSFAVKKRVTISGALDSQCFTIYPGTSKHATYYEMRKPIHTHYYTGTTNC